MNGVPVLAATDAGPNPGGISKQEESALVRWARGPQTAGLPTVPGKDAGKPLDPAKVAEQARHLSYPARIALPATLAATMNQERTLAEINNQERPRGADTPAEPPGDLSLVPTKDGGFVRFSVKLIESRYEEHVAMKAAPKKSALDNLSLGNTADAANEILNEMQRSRGGDKVQEDVSRYQVTLRRQGSPDWSSQVIGPPRLLPLQTVVVLSANKTIDIFDKNNRRIWQNTLSYNISGGDALDEASAPFGLGPCVERQGSLYVFDEGVLTAFDLATGNPRWRFPSVGVVGLFFDDAGMMYVNTTTASPDSLKYSRQIDISQKTDAVTIKMDPRTGAVLWRGQLGGLINCVSGKFIYAVDSYMPEEPDEDYPSQTESQWNPFLRIKRINPRSGSIMWEHTQQRAPLDIQFDKNSIRLVFKKEVQVLRFLTF
jgi:hypothetical protein